MKILGFIGVCGFGYDHANDVYKYRNRNCIDMKLEFIHFAGTVPREQFKIFHFVAYMVMVNGHLCLALPLLNWIRQHGALDFLVLFLNLVKETFTEFLCPSRIQIIKPSSSHTYNCLAFYFIHEKIHWFVWLLKRYEMPQSWTRLANIHCHSLLIGSELQPLYIR
ncbi:hypothetical protein Ahy_B01g052884 [Arachis hypogaea]|uniref:Uncharacterized protein n=1 Tax=Arachis hypogaea TaxID=3818 RepID=A0A445AQK8_ARAHY|nr:hypothetical protein Ahy_B01g052884 [Arachis hypogaea]